MLFLFPLNIIPETYHVATPMLFGVTKVGSFSMPYSIAVHTHTQFICPFYC